MKLLLRYWCVHFKPVHGEDDQTTSHVLSLEQTQHWHHHFVYISISTAVPDQWYSWERNFTDVDSVRPMIHKG